MSPAANAHHLAVAAAQRSARTLDRACTALAEMTREGRPVTVAELARRARVSRSWLYTQPTLLHDLTRHQPLEPTSTPEPPAAERATEAALLQRLSLTQDRNRALAAEVAELRDQIAVLYGELRALKLTTPTSPVGSRFSHRGHVFDAEAQVGGHPPL